jgi:hypothetical protein
MIDEILLWLFGDARSFDQLVWASIVAAAVGVAVAPAIAAARWAARGRTRLVRPCCRRCGATLAPVHASAIADRCAECGAVTSAPRAVRWTERGSRIFSLTATLPTMLLAAVGIAFLVAISVSHWLARREPMLAQRRLERTVGTSRSELLARLDSIERGEPTAYLGSLADRLRHTLPSSYSAFGATGFPREDPFFVEVRGRVERLLAEPDLRIPRRLPPAGAGEIAWDLLPLLPHLAFDEATLLRLLGPIRVTAPAEVTMGAPAPLIVESTRFASQLSFLVRSVSVDGEPVAAQRDPSGAIRSGCLWKPPVLADDEPTRQVMLTVEGHFELLGPWELVTVKQSIPVRIARRTWPQIVEDPHDPARVPDPFSVGSGSVEAACIPFDGVSVGWVVLRAAEGLGVIGTIEVEEDGVWVPLFRVEQPTQIVTAQWLRTTAVPPKSIRLRVRPQLDGPPAIGVGRALRGPVHELRRGLWIWELFPLAGEDARLRRVPVGDVSYLGGVTPAAK